MAMTDWVAEGLQQVHDRLRERPRHLAPDHQRADHAVLPQERDREQRGTRLEHEGQRIVALLLEVGDLHGRARFRRPPDHAFAEPDVRLAEGLTNSSAMPKFAWGTKTCVASSNS